MTTEAQTRSEQITDLLTALSKAQGEMGSAAMDKGSTAFGGRAYRYASLTAILKVVKPAFSKHGLCVIQIVEEHGGKLSLMTMIGHQSGQFQKSWIPLMIDKQTSQGLGSAITYARRYALSAVAGVETDEDDDGQTAEEEHRKAPPPREPAGPPPDVRPKSTPPASKQKPPVEPQGAQAPAPDLATPEQRDSVKVKLTTLLGLSKEDATAWLKANSPKPKSSDWTQKDVSDMIDKIEAEIESMEREGMFK